MICILKPESGVVQNKLLIGYIIQPLSLLPGSQEVLIKDSIF